ncbi:hypothetical protein ACIOEX_18625 [Streptomyces sp. NPDC087850]|uniref:hypothetical protein n=1 Tax=unclassified Streptomyces TaxID=2593676 RepID=UPI003830AFDD
MRQRDGTTAEGTHRPCSQVTVSRVRDVRAISPFVPLASPSAPPWRRGSYGVSGRPAALVVSRGPRPDCSPHPQFPSTVIHLARKDSHD